MIAFARKIKTTGVNKMDFNVFNTAKMDEYAREAKNNGDRLQNTRNMKKRQKISLPRHKNSMENLMLIL